MLNHFGNVLGSILVPTWLHFGAVWAPKTHLGSVLGHLGGVMGACWGVLGASWSFLGASWGVLGASWGVLEASWAPKPPNINLTRHGTGSAVLFKVFMPTWLRVGLIFRVLGRLGTSWGRLGSVLGASWGRLGASWGRLGRDLGL